MLVRPKVEPLHPHAAHGILISKSFLRGIRLATPQFRHARQSHHQPGLRTPGGRVSSPGPSQCLRYVCEAADTSLLPENASEIPQRLRTERRPDERPHGNQPGKFRLLLDTYSITGSIRNPADHLGTRHHSKHTASPARRVPHL